MRAPRVLVVLTAAAFAVAVPLGAGAAATSSGVTPPPTGSISGTVTGKDGAPVAGACVSLAPAVGTPPPTVTAADGTYAFSGLQPSPIDGYNVYVDPTCSSDPLRDDYMSTWSDLVYVQSGQDTVVDVSLALGGSAKGYVLDADGEPLAGACVAAFALSGPAYGFAEGYTQTLADGSYVLRAVPAGTYRVEIDGCYSSVKIGIDIQPEYYDETNDLGTQDDNVATVITVVAGQQLTLVSQRTQAGADIAIKIDSDIAPGAEISPEVIPQGLSTRLPTLGLTDMPDADGYWHITNLIPGRYEIGYQYCGDSSEPYCRSGYIGHYQHAGLDDPPTSFEVVAGETKTLVDSVVVPPIVDTSIEFTASPGRVTPGSQMTVAAKVLADSGSHVPSGRVDFIDLGEDDGSGSGVFVGQSYLDAAGVATLSWITLPGEHTIAAYYTGDGGCLYSSGRIVITDGVAPGGVSGGGGGGGGGAPPAPSPVSGTVGDGGSLSSDPSGTTPDESNPLVVDVTTPAGGSISIDKTPPNTSVAGYRVLNVGATITAPPASASDPLRLTFQVYDGNLPEGSYGSDLTVFRNGVAVGECAGPDVADPDPCVAQRSTSGGVTTITVLSSHASEWDVEAANVGRIGGADRIGTAVAVSRDSFPSGGAGAVVLARADDYPDALVGAPLAAQKDAPLLLTQGAELPSSTKQEIARVLPKGQTVYVLGGPAAVPDSVVAQLQADGYVVVRYGGADRYATAVAVADALGDPATVLLATGANFPDALAAGPAAAHLRAAVLLTNGDDIPPATSAYLASNPSTVYAVGGPAAAADPSATPVFGADRYATATAVATTFFGSPATVGIATALAFPDALSGGAQLALADSPLLLANPRSAPSATTAYLTGMNANLTTAHVYGGPAALSDAVLAQLRQLLDG